MIYLWIYALYIIILRTRVQEISETPCINMQYSAADIREYLPEGIQIDRFGKKGGISILTHYHTDHIQGLIDKPRTTKLICSQVTGRILAKTRSRITHVTSLRFGEAYTLPLPKTSSQCVVTLFDAQHMVGSAMCMLQIGGSEPCTIFYTGDYRLRGETTLPNIRIDFLFVDRTFHHVSSECLPTIEESATHAHAWLSKMLEKYESVDIGYYHLGTCELLLALTRLYGYKFCLPETLPNYELCVADFTYGEIVDPCSAIKIVWVPKREKNKPKPPLNFPTLLPSAQWEAFTNQCSNADKQKYNRVVYDPVRGAYRLAFSTHATGDENAHLVNMLRPRNCFLIA